MDIVVDIVVGYIKLCLMCLAILAVMFAYDYVRWYDEMFPDSSDGGAGRDMGEDGDANASHPYYHNDTHILN